MAKVAWARREVPKDHTCLFTSLIYLLEDEAVYKSSARRFEAVVALRKHCADTVLGDPATWPEWKLGRQPDAYAAWIQKSDAWGGEIELVVLAAKLGVEVCVVDMATQAVINYGTETAAARDARVHLLFTGQHYDPVVQVGPDGADVRVVPRSSAGGPGGSAEAGGEALKALARREHATAERKKRQRVVKKIKCTDCGAVLDNASAFQEHCMDDSIEHSEDFAYECEEVTIVMDEAEHSATLKAGAYDLESPDTQMYYDIPAVPLSNLYPAVLTVGKLQFPTAEHYIQFQRFAGNAADPAAAAVAAAVLTKPDTQQLALAVAGKEKLQDPAWDGDDGGGGGGGGSAGGTGGRRAAATRAAMLCKFRAHADLRAQLLGTAKAGETAKVLVCLGDDLWGGVTMRSGLPEGRNHFGRILADVRTELQAEKAAVAAAEGASAPSASSSSSSSASSSSAAAGAVAGTDTGAGAGK